MASISIIEFFVVVTGLQERNQSHSVRPETVVLMDDGMVVEICTFLVCLSLFTQFLASFLRFFCLVESRHVRSARLPCCTSLHSMFDTRKPLSNCGEDSP